MTIARAGPLHLRKKTPAFNIRSYALDNHSPLRLQLHGIPLMTLLLAVFQSAALMVLQHSVFSAEMPRAEAAIADNALRRVLAVFECTADLFRGHSTS